MSRSATSTTTRAGSTAISGASADRNTAMSSATTKMIENHWTWPPVLPEVALLSTRVATWPAVCTCQPGRQRRGLDGAAQAGHQAGLLRGGQAAGLGQGGQHGELLGPAVG